MEPQEKTKLVELSPDEIIVKRSLLRDLHLRLHEKAKHDAKEVQSFLRQLSIAIGDIRPGPPVIYLPSKEGKTSKCRELAKKMRID